MVFHSETQKNTLIVLSNAKFKGTEPSIRLGVRLCAIILET